MGVAYDHDGVQALGGKNIWRTDAKIENPARGLEVATGIALVFILLVDEEHIFDRNGHPTSRKNTKTAGER